MKKLAAALSLLLLACCSSSSNVSGERRNVGSVTMTFTVVPSTAKAGESIRLTIRLVNNGGTTTKLTFASGQKYDFWITKGGAEIWRASSGQMYTQEITHQEIGGQTGAVFAQSWTAGSPGIYVAHAELKADTYQGEMKGRLTVR
jgi:Intracellular proteinase inhibitor